MDMVPLKAKARAKESVAKTLVRSNLVPCILYGNEAKNTPLQCEYNEIYKAYAKAGESTLVELEADGKKIPVLFYDIDFEPVSGRIRHVDFYAVNMKKEIEARVPIHFLNESPAVKFEGGVLVAALDHLTIRCLPGDLPHEVTVSLTSLEKFGDSLHVRDVAVPANVVVQEKDDVMVATVQEPRKEEEPEPVAPVEGAEGVAAEAGAEGAPAEGAAEPAAPAAGGKEKKSE